jgi:hypothetical protein
MMASHEPGTPHYSGSPSAMEERLIDEIVQVQAALGLDLLGPKSAEALRAASTEALGRQSDRYENLAHLYRQLAIRRGPAETRCRRWAEDITTSIPLIVFGPFVSPSGLAL